MQRVRVCDRMGVPAFPLPYLNVSDGERIPYTNKISGKSDPIIMLAPPSRWVHESTLLMMGYQIREIQ